MSTETIDFSVHVNGQRYDRAGIRADMLLIDFLHEDLGLTGTKFSCGIGACGACKVAVQENDDAPLIPVLSCFARLKAVNGLRVTTVEGLSSDGGLHPLQQAFLDRYAFQCGFSTPGFLMAGYVLLDHLRHRPVRMTDLDATIVDAIGGNVCRCTGYIRYFEAIRDVIRATPELLRDDAPTKGPAHPLTFRIIKQSANDLGPKVLIGHFRRATGLVHFSGGRHIDTCRALIEIDPSDVLTGEPVRDLNLNRFFFVAGDKIRFELTGASQLDPRLDLDDLEEGATLPLSLEGWLRVGPAALRAQVDAFVSCVQERHLRVVSRAPMVLDPRDLGFTIDTFAAEFGIQLSKTVEVSLDLRLPYEIDA